VEGSWKSVACTAKTRDLGSECYSTIPFNEIHEAFRSGSLDFQWMVFDDKNFDRQMNPDEMVYCSSDKERNGDWFSGNWLDVHYTCIVHDADYDGLPNRWEWRNGLDAEDPTDAGKDSDGDGFSNLKEFLEGTDPQNASDYPAVVAATE
jgi:hypothetical protein